MTDDTRPPVSAPSAVALFRHAVLSQVEALVLGGSTPSRAVREVASREHLAPGGRLTQVSVRTIQRWRAAHAAQGFAGLEPTGRGRIEASTVLPDKLVAFFIEEKELDPRASMPELLRRARVRKIIAQDLPVDRTTAWRTAKRLGLPTRRRASKREGDSRRWSYPHRMQCVLCDGKHFRAGASRARRVALFFLDDATRYGLHVVVCTAENAEDFLHGLHELVSRYGLFDLLFIDRGAGFKALDTRAVVEQGLGAWLIHGRTQYPEGHGKIERFNQTAWAGVLRSLDGAADVDPGCASLTLRLQHFLDHDYNLRPHESLGLVSPRERFEQGRPLRFPDDPDDLYRRFVVREPRTVSADHVIQYGGQLWEAPRGLREQQVEVVRHVLDGRLFVPHRGELVLLHVLDPHRNATDRRGYPRDEEPYPGEGVPTTAATEAFRQDFAPIVDRDGGFPDTE